MKTLETKRMTYEKEKYEFMSPAQIVIEKFGGIPATAEAIGVDRSWVWRWTQPKSKRGTAGQIPTRSVQKIIAAAKRKRITLTAKDLVGDV